MIRINLLPVSEDEVLAQGRIQLLLFIGVLVTEAVILGFIYTANQSELEELSQKVQTSQTEVNKVKQDVKDADALKKQTETLQKQLDVLDELKQKRAGPVKVLDELQAMMSPPRNEEDRFAQLQKNWNVEWDTRRLWLGSFEEKAGSFDMSGSAVSADDVAEFLQRLNTAEHFFDIQLDVVQAVAGKSDKREVRYVDFHIMGRLSYRGKSLEKPEPEDDKKKQGRRR